MKRQIGFILLVLALVVSCGKKTDRKGIELDVTIKPELVTDFSFIKLDFNFDITDKFIGLNKDYAIFVHFWRTKSDEMLFQDDHQPPKKTSAWKAGDHIQYSRKRFIPKFLDEIDIDFEGYEEIKLVVGLWDPTAPQDRITLLEKEINIKPASINAPEIIYSEGWNNIETDLKIKNPDIQKWRWTTKKAVCIIENPFKDATLIIRGASDKNKFTDQKVIFKINDTVLDEFIPESSYFDKEYEIKQDMIGKETEFKLTIETDKTFVPSNLNPESTDNRELGLQIFFLYFRELI